MTDLALRQAIADAPEEVRAAFDRLQRNEERYTLAMRGATDGLWDWDLRTNHVHYSTRWKSMLGYADDELAPTIETFTTLVHPADGAVAMAAVDAYLSGAAERYEVVLRMRHRRGHYVDVLSRGFAARDDEGTPYRLVGTHVEITEHRRSEQRLAAQSRAASVLASATTLMETLPRVLAAIGGGGHWTIGVVWVVDASADVLRCLALWHASDLVLGRWEPQIRGMTRQRGEGPAGSAWNAGIAEWLEDEQLTCRSGAAVELGLRASVAVPLAFEGRTVAVLQFCARDRRVMDPEWIRMIESLYTQATETYERRRAERQLRDAERRYREMFEQSHQGMFQVTGAGRVVSANRAFARILGLASPEEAVALSPDQVRETIGDRALDSARTLLAAAGHIEDHEILLPRRDGGHVWINVNAHEVRGPSGELLYYEGSIEDVTARRDADQMKSDFVSFVTHQLRTPLAGVRWMLELSEQEASIDEMRSCIADARESAERMIRLVNDLLDAARLESGKLVLHPEPLDLAAIVGSVVAELRPLAEARRQTLAVESPEAAFVAADPQLTRQVVLNLLSNAIKYTPEAGAIALTLRPSDTGLTCSVRDTGIGIPAASRERLFGKFYRAPNATTVDTEGTGLGLYLVRLIVERSGGRVWCESAEGAGSTFSFTLPGPAPQETP